MKQIITILIAIVSLSSFGQDTSKTTSSQDRVFYVSPTVHKETAKKQKSTDDGYKLVTPKSNVEYADYKLVTPSQSKQNNNTAYIAKSTDSVYYEQNSTQYYNDDNQVTDLETKREQLRYAQANTYLTYNTVKFLQATTMR